MITSWFKRITWIASPLVVGIFVVACQGSVDTDSEPVEDVGAAQEELINCVGQCVRFFRACVAAGVPASDCAAERDACKAECEANTCEPGDPGCCQGQPTCW
jgi:hypothetical protein